MTEINENEVNEVNEEYHNQNGPDNKHVIVEEPFRGRRRPRRPRRKPRGPRRRSPRRRSPRRRSPRRRRPRPRRRSPRRRGPRYVVNEPAYPRNLLYKGAKKGSIIHDRDGVYQVQRVILENDRKSQKQVSLWGKLEELYNRFVTNLPYDPPYKFSLGVFLIIFIAFTVPNVILSIMGNKTIKRCSTGTNTNVYYVVFITVFIICSWVGSILPVYGHAAALISMLVTLCLIIIGNKECSS